MILMTAAKTKLHLVYQIHNKHALYILKITFIKETLQR